MSSVRFTEDHEYIRVDGDVGTIGITDYAQEQLGDVVFVEMPQVGKTVARGEEFAVVESVKAAGEVLAPVSGEVIEVNGALEEAPATVNEDAAGAGWIARIRISDRSELDDLMDAEGYAAFIRDLD
jgi:glycine cleavage system H protein